MKQPSLGTLHGQDRQARAELSWRWLVVLAAAAVLSACSAAAESDQFAAAVSGDDSSAAPSAEVGAQAATAGDEGGGDDGPRTLQDYLGGAAGVGGGRAGGAGFGGFSADEDEVVEQQRLIQQAIQVCMQAQGFLYTPEAVGDGFQFFLATQNQGTDPADYAATEGFGISTRFDALLDGDVDLTESVEPNDEHLESLSEGEADAWNLALNGVPPERNAQGRPIDPETGEVLQGRGAGQASGGCQRTAQTEVRGDIVALGTLEDELVLLADRIASDPRITDIARQWTDCMIEEGFDYNDEGEARADINAQVTPLLRSFFAGATDQQVPAEARGQGGGGGNQLQAIAGLQLTPEQDAELEALQDLERSMAVASLMCNGDTGDEIADITKRYEAEFIDANRAALEALSS